MPLKLGVNIDISQLEKIPFSQRLLILAGLLIVIAVIYVWIGVLPKTRDIASLKGRLNDVQKKYVEQKAIADSLEVYKKEVENLQKKLEEAVQKLPRAAEVEKLLLSVTNIGKESNLEFEKFVPKGDLPKGMYSEIPVDITVTGRYHSIAIFLDRISKLERIIKPKDISIKPVKEGDSNLTASFLLETYKFIEGGTQPPPTKK